MGLLPAGSGIDDVGELVAVDESRFGLNDDSATLSATGHETHTAHRVNVHPVEDDLDRTALTARKQNADRLAFTVADVHRTTARHGERG